MKPALDPTLPGWLPMARRPKCKFCEKPLPPKAVTETVTVEDDPFGTGPTTVEKPVRVVFGHDGDGTFCGPTCGYRFALGALERSRKPGIR